MKRMKRIISMIMVVLFLTTNALAYTTTIRARGMGILVTTGVGNTIKITPKTQKITGWEVEEGNIEIVDNRFIMPEENVKIKGIEEEGTYLLTIESTYFIDKEYRQAGETITLQAVTENEGYVFSSWTATGLTLTEEQKTSPIITFTMPENAVTLLANYEEATIYPMLASQDTWYTQGNSGIDKTQVTSITLSDSTAPNTYTKSWDASSEQVGNITAYIVEEAEKYSLHIVGDGSGKISANIDSSNAFAGFTGVTEINNLNLLSTNNVTNMSNMFNELGSDTIEGILPKGYTLLEYIECDGTQYIDTGFRANQNSRVVMDVQANYLESGGTFPFGYRTSVNSNAFTAALVPGQVFYNYGTTYEFKNYANTYERMIIDANKNTATFTGSQSVTITLASATFTTPGNLLIGTASNNGTPYSDVNAWNGKIYSCQIYDNNILVHDFVPCMNTLGEVGLYDVVSKTFYSNNGTGTFTAGTNLANTFSVIEGNTPLIIDLSSWDMSNVTNTSEMFKDSAIEELTIPASLSVISNEFGISCPILNKITFLHSQNDTVTMPIAGSETGAFYVPYYIETSIITSNNTLKNYDWALDNRAEARLGSVRIVKEPNQTIYETGGKFDSTGMIVEAVYTNNTTTALVNPNSLVPSGTMFLLHGADLIDSSESKLTVTNSGITTSTVVTKFGNGSLYFNGNSCLKLPGSLFNFGTGDFTIELWARPESISNDNFFFSGDSNGALFFGRVGGNNTLGIGRAGVAWDNQISANLTLNDWNHVAITRQNGIIYYFINGTKVGTASNTTNYSMLNGTISIGAQNNNYYYKGYMEEIRVSNIATWTSDFSVPTTPYEYGTPYTIVDGDTLLLNQTSVTISYTEEGITKTASQPITIVDELYNITYNLDGGVVTGNPVKYSAISETITLLNPTKSGYVFAGWTGSNGNTPSTTVTIPKGSTGNKTFTANWTPITLNISGVGSWHSVYVNGTEVSRTNYTANYGDTIMITTGGSNSYIYYNGARVASSLSGGSQYTFVLTKNIKITSEAEYIDGGGAYVECYIVEI